MSVFARMAKSDAPAIHGVRVVQVRVMNSIDKTDACARRDGVLCAFYLVDNGLESSRIVEGEVGQHFAVDFDTRFVYETHQL